MLRLRRSHGMESVRVSIDVLIFFRSYIQHTCTQHTCIYVSDSVKDIEKINVKISITQYAFYRTKSKKVQILQSYFLFDVFWNVVKSWERVVIAQSRMKKRNYVMFVFSRRSAVCVQDFDVFWCVVTHSLPTSLKHPLSWTIKQTKDTCSTARGWNLQTDTSLELRWWIYQDESVCLEETCDLSSSVQGKDHRRLCNDVLETSVRSGVQNTIFRMFSKSLQFFDVKDVQCSSRNRIQIRGK